MKNLKRLAPVFIVLVLAIVVVLVLRATPRPRPVSTPTPAQDVESWRVYQNQEYGFELRYPPDWELRQEMDSTNPIEQQIITLTSPLVQQSQQQGIPGTPIADISISVRRAFSLEQLDQELQEQVLESGYNFIVNKRLTKINGYKASVMTIGGYGAELNIYFPNAGNLYHFLFSQTATLQELTWTENLILSTFRFLDN